MVGLQTLLDGILDLGNQRHQLGDKNVDLEACIAAVRGAGSPGPGWGEGLSPPPQRLPVDLGPDELLAVRKLLCGGEPGESESSMDRVVQVLESRITGGERVMSAVEAISYLSVMGQGTPLEKLQKLFAALDRATGSKGYLTREDVVLVTRGVLMAATSTGGSSALMEEVVVAVVEQAIDAADPTVPGQLRPADIERAALVAAPRLAKMAVDAAAAGRDPHPVAALVTISDAIEVPGLQEVIERFYPEAGASAETNVAGAVGGAGGGEGGGGARGGDGSEGQGAPGASLRPLDLPSAEGGSGSNLHSPAGRASIDRPPPLVVSAPGAASPEEPAPPSTPPGAPLPSGGEAAPGSGAHAAAGSPSVASRLEAAEHLAEAARKDAEAAVAADLKGERPYMAEELNTLRALVNEFGLQLFCFGSGKVMLLLAILVANASLGSWLFMSAERPLWEALGYLCGLNLTLAVASFGVSARMLQNDGTGSGLLHAIQATQARVAEENGGGHGESAARDLLETVETLVPDLEAAAPPNLKPLLNSMQTVTTVLGQHGHGPYLTPQHNRSSHRQHGHGHGPRLAEAEPRGWHAKKKKPPPPPQDAAGQGGPGEEGFAEGEEEGSGGGRLAGLAESQAPHGELKAGRKGGGASAAGSPSPARIGRRRSVGVSERPDLPEPEGGRGGGGRGGYHKKTRSWEGGDTDALLGASSGVRSMNARHTAGRQLVVGERAGVAGLDAAPASTPTSTAIRGLLTHLAGNPPRVPGTTAGSMGRSSSMKG